ncbi:PDC sensor domain-containing protein [Burkholderia diffusa]|uniref:PDC sensor domain-containing protein n=1 Tax=Burkholderia diffusa TaxID=488732 RepID=UPI00076CBD19|nr:PDC sensor domain-containing protein [Burkholderia diffusa]KVN02946.1 hypothetical protein WJ62_12130 [Burkholderia diffusa]
MLFVQRDQPDRGLYVSEPFVSRLTGGVPAIALTRRLSHPDGLFAGVALRTVNLDHFRTLLAGLALGSRGSLSLIGQDE